jgi:glucuronoarabinoxylan endo-1,4-beta-xylanase
MYFLDFIGSNSEIENLQPILREPDIHWSKIAIMGRLALMLFALSFLALMLLAWPAQPQDAVINWTDVHQEIDGFGGSCADFHKAFSPKMVDFFFSTSGIGLSLLRVQVVPSAADCASFFVPNGGSCMAVPSGATILRGELSIAQQAVARGVKVWSAPWSPPASMKSNGSFINGGSLLRADYSAWADTLAGYVKMMNSNGVPIYAMSVQNEPDNAQSWGSATYTAQQMHDFVPHLYSALQSAGVGSTKIMIAEAAQWDFSLAAVAMDDPTVAGDVGILAAHGYGSARILAPRTYGKHVWQTENSSTSLTYDGSMKDGLSWASVIHRYLAVANVNAWHAWFLSDGPDYGGGTDNAALTDIDLNYPKRAYVIGQWSKFVRPGWYRIGVSYSFGPLGLTAFKDPDSRSFAIVAINPGRIRVRQTFSLNGFSTNAVTPWITSARLSLAAQPPISVSGASFTYTLPASSVTTFSGSATQSATNTGFTPKREWMTDLVSNR